MLHPYVGNDLKLWVFDRRKEEPHLWQMRREQGATYGASCCGAYWMLYATKDGVTNVTLFYLANSVRTWTNTESEYYTFPCCGAAGRLTRYTRAAGENEETETLSEIIEVYVCGHMMGVVRKAVFVCLFRFLSAVAWEIACVFRKSVKIPVF